MKTKVCTKCGGEPKPLNEFSKSKCGKYGHKSVCKLCSNIEHAKYREVNKEKIKASFKKRYDTNEHKDKVKNYRNKNKKAFKKYHNEYYKNNKDKFDIYAKNRKESGKLKKYTQKYYAENADKIKNRQQLQSDNLTDYYIKQNLCGGNKVNKEDITKELIEVQRIRIKIIRQLRG